MIKPYKALPPPNPSNPVRRLCRQSSALAALRASVAEMQSAARAVLQAGFPDAALMSEVGDPLEVTFGLGDFLADFAAQVDVWGEVIYRLDEALETEIRAFSCDLEAGPVEGDE